MLQSLYIKNFAIIDELRVNFKDGLNIITGETGAGKSLIIKAIQFLLGERFTGEVLRTGTNQMVIEGVFGKNDAETTIRRLYRSGGQSKSFINEEPVRQKDLLKVTRKLIDLHGQHDHQNLLDAKTHIQYLDAFGMYSADLMALKSLFNKTQVCQNTLNNLKKEQIKLEEKQELHNYQLKELSLYPLNEEYEQKITKQYRILSNAEEIKETLSHASDIIDNGQYSILKSLNQLNRTIDGIAKHDDEITDISKRISCNIIELEDIRHVIHTVEQGVCMNHTKLKESNEILNHLELLKRKYGGSMASVEEYYYNIQAQEEKTGSNNEKIQRLDSEQIVLQKELNKKAEWISDKRHKTALKLEKRILDNLQSLNMPNTDFKIQISTDENIMSESGMDSCEIFISTNSGETLRPLSKIASGGEISRIMLAIKMALQSRDFVSILVFDEIDSGISGSVAEKIGNTIENLSQSHQILCITHLSQIAGKGEHHYKVQKNRINHRNVAKIKKLSTAERVREVAELISGKEITKASRKQAQILLEHG